MCVIFRIQANYIFWKITESLYSFLSFDIRREFEMFEKINTDVVPQKRMDFCYGVTSTVYGIWRFQFNLMNRVISWEWMLHYGLNYKKLCQNRISLVNSMLSGWKLWKARVVPFQGKIMIKWTSWRLTLKN